MFHYELAIIGGGPAGLAAAATAINAHLDFVLIAPDIGGKASYGFALRDGATSEPVWGATFVDELHESVQAYPERHIKQKVSALERDDNGLFHITLVGPQSVEQTILADAVVVATGAEPRRLYLKGEKEYWGRGLSYSTVSHAQYMQDRNVAVIGSGPRAVTAALRLSTIAKHVTLLPVSTLPTVDPRFEQMAKNTKISVLEGWELQGFAGDEFLKEIVMVQNGIFRSFEVDAAFVELGLLPDKEFLRGLVTFDPGTGQIPINQLCETETPGLYAAGDVTNTFAEQIPVAIGEGIKATLSAWAYLASVT